ncbi:hypothetical protein ACE193_23775 [Bernardetia sp. OM2101]|uniref:hypothetical protein n=1 Tax=Bernardetia sp. OM2101 TaxID=3344876 RepID=UPI0035CF0413
MENIDSTLSTDEIVIKYTDLLQEYEHFLYESKGKISSFWLGIQLWFIGKIMLYIFMFFIKNKLKKEVIITPLNYNAYLSKKNELKLLLEHKKGLLNHKSEQKVSWVLRSFTKNLSKIISKVEDYTKQLEFSLVEVEKQIEQEIVFMKDVKEFDFDNYIQPPIDENIIGSIESDEDIEDLLNLLTK